MLIFTKLVFAIYHPLGHFIPNIFTDIWYTSQNGLLTACLRSLTQGTMLFLLKCEQGYRYEYFCINVQSQNRATLLFWSLNSTWWHTCLFWRQIQSSWQPWSLASYSCFIALSCNSQATSQFARGQVQHTVPSLVPSFSRQECWQVILNKRRSRRMHTVVSFSYTVVSWSVNSCCLVGKLRRRMRSEVKWTQTINLNLHQFPILAGCMFIESSRNPKGEDASGRGQLLSVVIILTVVRTHTTSTTFLGKV